MNDEALREQLTARNKPKGLEFATFNKPKQDESKQ